MTLTQLLEVMTDLGLTVGGDGLALLKRIAVAVQNIGGDLQQLPYTAWLAAQ